MGLKKYRTWRDVVDSALSRRGMNYRHLAERMGVSYASARTRAQTENPTLEIIEAVAHALGLYPDELLQRRRIPEVPLDKEWGTKLVAGKEFVFDYSTLEEE